MIDIYQLELNMVYGCNLSCRYCTHFSPYMRGYETLDNIHLWLETWLAKVNPHAIRLLGGEPLLHPALDRVLTTVRQLRPKGKIQLVTNGLLLRKQPAKIFESIHDNDIELSFTIHYPDKRYVRQLELCLQLLHTYDIKYIIIKSTYGWSKLYAITIDNKPVPNTSRHEEAWRACMHRNNCITLYNNKLYLCPVLAMAHRLYVEYGMTDWSILDQYEALSSDCSEDDLIKFVNSPPNNPVCSICPEKITYASLQEKSAQY